MTSEEFKKIALSMPNTVGKPHFDRMAFKVVSKRIFATLQEANNSANFKFSPIDQSAFCAFNKTAVYPAANKWGLQGWTTFELDTLSEEFVKDAIDTAYREVISSKVNKKH